MERAASTAAVDGERHEHPGGSAGVEALRCVADPAAIVLAAPYGIAVAVRSAIASIILWNAETAISRTAADGSAPLPAISTGQQATTGPSAAA